MSPCNSRKQCRFGLLHQVEQQPGEGAALQVLQMFQAIPKMLAAYDDAIDKVDCIRWRLFNMQQELHLQVMVGGLTLQS